MTTLLEKPKRRLVRASRTLAARVVAVVDCGLVRGMGKSRPGEMCVEAAVCYAMGLPHGDEPTCVDNGLRRLKIALNDADWTSNTARANGLRRLAVAQLGTAGTLDQAEFLRRAIGEGVRWLLPGVLRWIGGAGEAFERAAVACETAGPARYGPVAIQAQEVLDRHQGCSMAALVASGVVHADWFSRTTSSDYDYGYACYVVGNAASFCPDELRAGFAERVVKVLIRMKAPGAKFLDLAPLPRAARRVKA